MKVYTFAKVKIRLLQKSIFAKVEMVDFCKSRAGRAAQRNFFELDFDFEKSPENLKIGVRIPSNET